MNGYHQRIPWLNQQFLWIYSVYTKHEILATMIAHIVRQFRLAVLWRAQRTSILQQVVISKCTCWSDVKLLGTSKVVRVILDPIFLE